MHPPPLHCVHSAPLIVCTMQHPSSCALSTPPCVNYAPLIVCTIHTPRPNYCRGGAHHVIRRGAL